VQYYGIFRTNDDANAEFIRLSHWRAGELRAENMSLTHVWSTRENENEKQKVLGLLMMTMMV
jgi:hypothetical protein